MEKDDMKFQNYCLAYIAALLTLIAVQQVQLISAAEAYGTQRVDLWSHSLRDREALPVKIINR